MRSPLLFTVSFLCFSFIYLAFVYQIAIVTIFEVFCLVRYSSVKNVENHLFCSENRNKKIGTPIGAPKSRV